MVKVGDYVAVTTRHGHFEGFVTVAGHANLLDGTGRAIRPRLVSIGLGSKNGRPIGVTVFEHEVTVLPNPAGNK